MKSIYTFLLNLLLVILVPAFNSYAQFNPGLGANFGIDGDILSGQNLNGSFSGNGSHDWFKKSGTGINVGLGMIDTSGNSIYAAKIATGENFTFSKGMAFPMFSNQGGYLVMDTRYARDNFGLSGASDKSDATTYTNGSKNGDNPTGWSTRPNGGALPDKADIIDTYIHMRRDGTTINNTNPSHLILSVGISTLGNTGDRFSDFELYRSRIAYNQSTGVFSNSGPAATGGHSEWEFNPNGSIREIGDLTLTFAFNTGGVQEIAIYIWVSQSAYNSISPANFRFAANEYYGGIYGYAKVIPLASNPFISWGSSSTATINGPIWGTNSKSIGSAGQNFYATSYAAYDFAEAAIDLTSLGIDPALHTGLDPCAPPYTRVMAKTRSSSSFTSALQDFIGPYTFLDAPQTPAQITPKSLSCNITSAQLSPMVIVPGAVYSWTTSNGNIVSNPNATSITINKGGKYYLNAAITTGCPANIDSTIVGEDYYRPVATASTVGYIDATNPTSFANIIGGDVAASNFSTPYGGSVGLDWNWTGPKGYTSTSMNNSVLEVGLYTLVLTEQRNGCKDTATTAVAPLSTLPLKITQFTAVKIDNNQVLIKWSLTDETPQNVELQRSYNGVDYSAIAYSLAGNANANEIFSYNDNVSARTSNRIYYRLKIIEASGVVRYSWIINLSYTSDASLKFSASPNPANNYTVLSITNNYITVGEIHLVDLSGRLMFKKRIMLEKGTNLVMINELEKMGKGMYIIKVVTDDRVLTQKIIKSE